jgi:hypothetical protein
MNANEKPTACARIFSLHHLLNELLTCYGRVNKAHRQCFINDVPAHLVIPGDQVASLLGDLYEIISSNPSHTAVHISAMGDGRYVRLFAKEPRFQGYCFSGAIAA